MQQPVEVHGDEHEQIVQRVAAIDVAKASGMVCLRVPHETIPGRRVTKVWPVAATTAALIELGDHLRAGRVTPGGAGVHIGLLAPVLLPARGGRVDGVAGQPRAGQERPGPPEVRQARRGVAGEAGRAVHGRPVAGAHRADAARAGSGPGPVRPGRGPHPGQTADREAARGRPDQDLVGAHRRARGVRSGDDRGVDRRSAQPEGAGRAGPRPGPPQPGRPGTGPARPVHRPPRPAGPAAARSARRADRAHHRGHRPARRRDQRPAHPRPGHHHRPRVPSIPTAVTPIGRRRSPGITAPSRGCARSPAAARTPSAR
jgi:hypothetical protein